MTFRLLSFVLLLSSALLAQSDNAQASGFVKDPSGAAVVNASVILRAEAGGVERRASTNESGYWVIPTLPPGFYTLTVEATGFQKFVKTNNKLDANMASSIEATLTVGSVSETVEVVASAVAVQADTATVGKLIESSQIQNMMLNGRNPLYLSQLKAGVRGGALNGFSFELTLGNLSINGSRPQDNLVTVDGAVAIRTRGNNSTIGVADVDAVQEVQILTANYNAEYGRAAGGQIRMVTKSGGREFHGSVYEYFRNNALDANAWSRNRAGQAREANKFNQFGYVFSGPAYIPGKFNQEKSKLFFLFSQEYVRFRQEQTSIQTVPTALMRQGNFSELLSPANTFFGRVRAVNDPSTGTPFAGNIIPAARVSPNGLGFLKSYPEATPGFLQGTNNFLQTRPQPTNQRKDTVSIDFNASEKHMYRFRFQNYAYDRIDAFRTGFDLATTTWDRPNQLASLNYIWTVSPTLVNEFLATASVDRVNLDIDRTGARYDRSKYGINYPYIFPEKEIVSKIPTIVIPNFAQVDGGPYPARSAGPIFVFSDSLTKIAGSHTWKAGVSYEYSGQNDFDQINTQGVPGGTNNQNGRFAFSDARTGAATSGLGIANAAMGLFDTYAEIGQRSYTPYRGHMLEFFGQDAWKVSAKLRLELGVRYTLMTPFWYSQWRNIAVFDPQRYDAAKAVVQDPRTGYILSGDQYNGVVIPGNGWPDSAKGRIPFSTTGEFDRLFSGGGRAFPQLQKSNIQPRVGIAYSLSGKSVLRAGGGQFFARPSMSGNILLGGNPPFQPMASLANGQADNPGGGAAAKFPFFFMTIDPVFKIASAWNYNVTFERQIPLDSTVTVAYLGRVGNHLERESDINQLRAGTLQLPANRGINTNVLRPYKGYASIALREMAARSEYQAFQIEVNRRFGKGLGYGFAYTWSKSMDNGSDFRARAYDSYNDKSFWGNSDFDTRHIAVVNFNYQLPFFRKNDAAVGKLLGGWQVSGVTQFQTGTPVVVGTADDFAGIGNSNTQLWEMNGTPTNPQAFSESQTDSNFWFTPTANGTAIFAQPAAGTFSATQTRATKLFNPGFQNWNIAAMKDFRLNERHAFQVRAEFFNWPNHPNWGGVTANPRSAVFGKVNSKSSERNVQLSLRYSF